MGQESCKSRQRYTVARSQASLLGPDGPCKGVGSPNGWYAVPQQPGIVRSQLRCYRGHGAIAVTARSRSHRDRGHSAIGYRVPGAIAVTARSRSRRNRGRSAIAVTASSRSWRDRGPETGRLQPPTPPARSPASTRRHAIGPLQGPTPPSGSAARRAARRPTPGRSRTPDGGPQSADDEVVEASEPPPWAPAPQPDTRSEPDAGRRPAECR